MPSPFPGMDPWLEDPWIYADLRFTLVVRLSNALNALLPEGWVTRIRHITEEVGSVDAESFVEVIELRDRDEDDIPLTAIELPERHRGWRQCRAQGNWRLGRILVRLFRDPWAVPGGSPLPPQIVSQRFGECEHIETEEVDYTKPLPTLWVPWLVDGPVLEIPLQPLLNETYDTGRYSYWEEQYREPCNPPLTPEQRAWAEGVLRAKGLLP